MKVRISLLDVAFLAGIILAIAAVVADNLTVAIAAFAAANAAFVFTAVRLITRNRQPAEPADKRADR